MEIPPRLAVVISVSVAAALWRLALHQKRSQIKAIEPLAELSATVSWIKAGIVQVESLSTNVVESHAERIARLELEQRRLQANLEDVRREAADRDERIKRLRGQQSASETP